MYIFQYLLASVHLYITKKIAEFKLYRAKVSKIAYRVRKAKEHSKRLP